jgi:hypothetical protein
MELSMKTTKRLQKNSQFWQSDNPKKKKISHKKMCDFPSKISNSISWAAKWSTGFLIQNLRATFFNYQTPKKVGPHIKHSESTCHEYHFCQRDYWPISISPVLDSSKKFTPGFIENLKMLIKILVVEPWAIDLKFSTMLESTKKKFLMFWICRNSLHLKKNQKFMKKLKINFLRMSKILYLVSIQLWVIPAEISTPSGRPPQILNILYGFERSIPRLTFGVLTRFDTIACSEKSPCGVGRVGDFLNFFLLILSHILCHNFW